MRVTSVLNANEKAHYLVSDPIFKSVQNGLSLAIYAS